MRLRTQKQPQVKKELCRVLDDVDLDVDECEWKHLKLEFDLLPFRKGVIGARETRGERKENYNMFFFSAFECLVRSNDHPKQYFFVHNYWSTVIIQSIQFNKAHWLEKFQNMKQKQKQK